MIAKCASYDLIKLFLDYDIDVGMTDCNANNFIHILVTMVHLNPQMEADYIKTRKVLKNSTPEESLRSIRMHENNHGLRPLEMTAKLESWRIFLTIFATKNIYITHTKDFIHSSEHYYNVTEYQETSRMFNSP